MFIRVRWQLAVSMLGVVLCTSGCGEETPLQPVNRRPVVHSLTAFPTTIGLTDSAIVVCVATDVDGDTLVFDWTSNCKLIKQGEHPWGGPTIYNRGNTLVVYPGSCINAPEDTGWVSCSAHDGRGGGAYAGAVRIIIRQ